MVMELFVQKKKLASQVVIVTFMWHLNQCTLLQLILVLLIHMHCTRTSLHPLQHREKIAAVPTPPIICTLALAFGIIVMAGITFAIIYSICKKKC
jgi:hypothetical protein